MQVVIIVKENDVKTVEPPGDTSYVLEIEWQFMYYTWSYPWTMIGLYS